MSVHALIQDYLQTQGLNHDAQAVYMALLGTNAVIQHGQIDAPALPPPTAAAIEHFAEHRPSLQRIAMAVDATNTRAPVQSANVYVLLPNHHSLIAITQQGTSDLPHVMPMTADNAIARSAQTGWLNTEHNASINQINIPIHGTDGIVRGLVVIQQPAQHHFDDAQYTHWLGLTLAILPLITDIVPT